MMCDNGLGRAPCGMAETASAAPARTHSDGYAVIPHLRLNGKKTPATGKGEACSSARRS
jgi:hypothetical protein